MLRLGDEFVVRKAEWSDIPRVVDNMRDQDYVEITEGSGFSATECVELSYKSSEGVWVGEWKGELVCLGGITPHCALLGQGIPWMMTTNTIEKCPMAFLKAGRRFLSRIRTIYPDLHNYVDTRNTVSIKWLKWLGFTVAEEPVPFGPNRKPFHRFEMRD